jgi:ATP-dependent helicase/nuclease subunit A
VSREESALPDGLRKEDAQARTLAQREFDQPVVVEAGAGTGKTTALVARVLAWSFGPGWDRAKALVASTAEGARDDRIAAQVLRGIVAITFTEKAAAEMSERIGDALLEVEHGKPPKWLEDPVPTLSADEFRERARILRGSLDHLVVQTIHAYCRRLLVENSLDAQLHPNLEIDADGRLQEQAVRSAMEAALENAYASSGNPGFLALAARGIGPREIEQALIALLNAGFPSEALRVDPATPDRISALIARLREQLDDFAAMTGGDLSSGGSVTTDTAGLLGALRATLNERPPSDRAGFVQFVGGLRDRLTDRLRNRLKDWRKGKFNKGEAAALGDRIERLSARIGELLLNFDHVISIDLDLLDAARSALEAPLAAAETQLRAAGVLTFSALLGEVRRLLRDRPDVAARIRAGIDQLLVDEFQDTDQCQCEIVRALALDGPKDARPGLFIVGDPKQSIYSWRRADLAAYSAFVDEVCQSGGELVRLSVNFRSVPNVLDEVERVIAPVMEPVPGIQPAFEPLIACTAHEDAEGFCRGRLRSVEYWLPTGWDGDGSGLRETTAAEAAQIEATALARDLRELHDQHGVAWKSIGVLFRSRGDWEIYLPALRQAGIPYAAEGDRNYYRRREVIDAACLVRCVLDPNDQLALISYLRSVAVGVPDAAWIPLWSRGFPDQFARIDASEPETIAGFASLIRDAANAVDSDVPGIERISGWEENLLSAVADIARLRASFASDPTDFFIEKLRTRTLFEATESARYLGAWRCANLERFFREVSLDLETGRDPHDLSRQLRAAVASEKVAEEGRPVDSMADAVKVMTIHGAKGLGFEHVYLMQLHKGIGGGPEQPTQAAELAGGFEYRLLSVPTLAWDCVLRERKRSAEAERVRLLYVAMTRAKQRLVMTGLWSDHQQRSGRGQAIEHVQHRIQSTEGLAPWLSGPALDGTSDFVDRFGTRWSLPALGTGEEVISLGARVGGAELPSESEVSDASHRLAGLRANATERMSRPMSATASARDHGDRGDRQDGDWERHGGTTSGAKSANRRVIGSAIHRALEMFDFSADEEAEIEYQREALALNLAKTAANDHAEATVDDGLQLWDQIVRGSLFARLRELSDQIIARELSVLSPPIDDEGPVGYCTGLIDLVYRDPSNDQIVIVDYKTGALDDREGLRSPKESHVEQGDAYKRALESAFELSYTPRFELWFLRDDEIVQY